MKLDVSKNIQSVGMCFSNKGFAKGLRVMSDEGLLLCDEFWNPNGREKSNFDY